MDSTLTSNYAKGQTIRIELSVTENTTKAAWNNNSRTLKQHTIFHNRTYTLSTTNDDTILLWWLHYSIRLDWSNDWYSVNSMPLRHPSALHRLLRAISGKCRDAGYGRNSDALALRCLYFETGTISADDLAPIHTTRFIGINAAARQALARADRKAACPIRCGARHGRVHRTLQNRRESVPLARNQPFRVRKQNMALYWWRSSWRLNSSCQGIWKFLC